MVVDDSDENYVSLNRAHCAGMNLPSNHIRYLRNTRTKGFSGSLNQAIEHLVEQCDDPHSMFIAILNDVDAWTPTYLFTCLQQARTRSLDMVATDIRRITNVKPSGSRCTAPDSLTAAECLTANPGIQGSNLFIRLSTLLQAGGFDEALQSAFEQDLCIRLADLGSLQYQRHPQILIDHYAEDSRSRISTTGSQTKNAGLNAFWRKHHSRMNTEQRDAFCHRASTLFGWEKPPQRVAPTLHGIAAEPLPLCPPMATPFNLCIGVISADPVMLSPLLDGLSSLSDIACVRQLSVVVLANGCSPIELANCVTSTRDRGVSIAIISEEQQYKDASAGAFGQQYKVRSKGEVGIAQARTMLQRYLGEVLGCKDNTIGWILDDDMRVDKRAHDFLAWLPAFRQLGVDVLLGQYEGASPNPPLHGLRIQLVDLFHNLHWLRKLPPDQLLPDRSAENTKLRKESPDYYYDLSRAHTVHLESPYWIEPAYPGETCAMSLARLLKSSSGILAGTPLTRPLIADLTDDPLRASTSSVNRGGITFILNRDTLLQTPNPALMIEGREIRRSDMFWAIINKHYYQRRIERVAFPVNHLGRVTPSPSIDIVKVQGEILGASIYGALCDYLKDKPEHRLDFSPAEVETISTKTQCHRATRSLALIQSIYRITGLRESIRALNHSGELDSLLYHLDEWFSPTTTQQLVQHIEKLSDEAISQFLNSLCSVADEFSSIKKLSIRFITNQLYPAKSTHKL